MRWALVAALLAALILVPFVLFEERFDALAARLVEENRDAAGYAAAAVVMLLAVDVFLPIPSSVVSVAAGVLLGFWSGAAAIWVGMSAACVIGYAFGARASGAARRFVGEDGLARATTMAERFGDLAIVICRPVPVLAEASVILAGLVGRPFQRFLLVTTWANLGMAAGYAGVGAFSARVDHFLVAFLGAIALPGLALLLSKVWFRRRRV